MNAGYIISVDRLCGECYEEGKCVPMFKTVNGEIIMHKHGVKQNE